MPAARRRSEAAPAVDAAGRSFDLAGALLDLCSERPDISGKGQHSGPTGAGLCPYARGNPQPKRVKGGQRLFAAPAVRTWEVTYRLGAALRHAQANHPETSETDHERAAPRPHLRRAHFHTFWTGPRNNPSKRVAQLKWLPPIPVAFEDTTELDTLPAVIKRVS